MTGGRDKRRPSLTLVLGGAAALLPLVALWLLLRRPQLDVRWEHHPAHFWLVLGAAALSAVLAYGTGEAAARRGDARLMYVSLAFLSSAGFLGLHALATPGVLLADPNVGFAVATPAGVALGSLFAIRSTRAVSGAAAAREVALARRARVALLLFMAAWATVSLLGLPPLSGPPTGAERLPLLIAVPGVVLYLAAAWAYARLWLHRREAVLAAVTVAYLLLAQALVAMVLSRNWHISWWEWHLLLLAAFAVVAISSQRAWHEERFGALYLEDTSAGSREMSVLFADLQGFTTFSESHAADEVTEMLNEYFAVAVPAVTAHGGDVDRIVGDALMVTFNKRGDQPDHARRAAGAGLDMQSATRAVADRHPDWPRFRVGINTGPVAVTLLGARGGRTHTVIGDTVNTASRIEGIAPVGGVAIGAATLAAIPGATTRSMGPVALKGKTETAEAFVLVGLDGG
ncbi:MAG: adenylate/guanylate cyclase domain-containing protein [Dermatophilaceae bacterium]